MELTCAIIVITVGLVTATPYGYGTKSGALAKAEASAVAGGLPITAPSGAGYSGSYAKSSSSSYASSGASSSASSYSFSGSGAYPGGVPGASGCGTGACPSGAGYSPTSSGSQSYGINNAGATGAVSTGSGNSYNSDNVNQRQRGDVEDSQKATDCSSGSCQQPTKPAGYSNGLPNSLSLANSVASTGAVYGSPSKSPAIPDSRCVGGNCDNQPSPDNDKCISGQCGDNAKSSLNVNEKCTSGNCKVPQPESLTPYYRTNENNCASGNCGSTKDDNDIAVPKPNYQGKIYFSDNDKETNYRPSCASGNCGPNNAKPIYTQNSAPVSESTKCNIPGCNNYGQSSTAVSSAAATAYNKPSTQLVAPKEDTTCTTPNCQTGPVNTKPYNEYPTNYNAPSPIVTPNRNPSQCAGGTCEYSQMKTPYSTNYVNPTSGQIGTGCTSPNCGNNSPIKSSNYCGGGSCDYNPISEDSKDRQPGYNTNYPQGGATYNTPAPTGLGCSPGSPNCSPGPISSGQYNPAVTPSPYYTPPVIGSPMAGSSTYNKPSSYKPALAPPSGYSGSLNFPSSQPNNVYAAASSAQQSNEYNKPGNSGYGSYLSGPAFTSQGTSPSAGYSSAPNSGPYNSPGFGTYSAPGLNSPTQNCDTPNCLISGISNSVPSSPVVSGNIPKPTGVEKDKLPVYQGGFGGPSGILNPNDYHFSPPPSLKPSPLPLVPVAKPDCVSGNCGKFIPGGFGGPAGILKPNEHDVSPPTGFKPGSLLVGPGSKPDCVSGNCGQPVADSISPSYSGLNSGAQASASSKAVAYTGGFGGPPGILTPYDNGKINFPVGSKQFSQNALIQDSGNDVSNSNAENGSHGHNGVQAQSIAQANAVAGGTSGVIPHSGYKSGGCDGGCSNGSGLANYGSNGGYGLSKSGTNDGVHGGLSIASANAKSIAGAVPDARGGYASSSASAHASSGIKSSYGKR